MFNRSYIKKAASPLLTSDTNNLVFDRTKKRAVNMNCNAISYKYKIGLLVIIGLIAAFNAPPAAKMVFNTYVAAQDKKLPIYSVDIPEKKMSISFDAAWGA